MTCPHCGKTDIHTCTPKGFVLPEPIDRGLYDDIPLYSHEQLLQALRDWSEEMARMTEAGVLGHGECADAIREKVRSELK